MGLEEQAREKDIDGIRYKVMPLPFRTCRRLLIKTIKILSPMFSVFADGNSPKARAEALEAIPTVLDDEDMIEFSKEFGKASWYQNGDNWVPLLEAAQDIHFAAAPGKYMRWLAFNMEVNFSDFFTGKGGETASADLLAMFKAKS